MTQYAIFLYAPQEDQPETLEERLEEHQDHSDVLANSGAMVTAFRLEDPDMTTSIRGDVITDGPFIESKEVIAGFYVIEAPHLDAALEIARQNPILHQGGGLEIRPVHSSR
jgi:hypothetical protein